MVLDDLPFSRLVSRNTPWQFFNQLNSPFNVEEEWKLLWQRTGYTLENQHLIRDPNIKVDGFNLERQTWVRLNRI